MKSWFKLALALSGLFVLGSCADGKAYPAPYGSTLTVSTDSITLGGFGGPPLLLEAAVVDPNQGADGMLLSNTQVTIQSLYKHYILVPESAINVQTSAGDTDWQCHADEEPAVDQCVTTQCASLSGDDYNTCAANCRTSYCAEQYYEWASVNNEINPNYLETATDSHGVAKVYVYIQCIPLNCGASYGPSFDSSGNALDCTDSEFPSDSCSGVDSDIVFSIGVDTQKVTLTASSISISTSSSSSGKPQK